MNRGVVTIPLVKVITNLNNPNTGFYYIFFTWQKSGLFFILKIPEWWYFYDNSRLFCPEKCCTKITQFPACTR